jgi:murein DD-endopeptidase MepM/ murein hydrolase activator NlpD
MARTPFEAGSNGFAISQPFGRPDPRYSALGLLGHNGVDYAVPDDTRIVCVEDGEVWESAYDPDGYGFYVKVRTPGGSDWLYAHLHPWDLPHPGTWLPAGAPVGWSNNTGMSTGPHLHLGYRPQWWVRGWPYDGYADPLPRLAQL